MRVVVDKSMNVFSMTIIDGSDSMVVLRDGRTTKVAVCDGNGRHTAESSPTGTAAKGDLLAVSTALRVGAMFDRACGAPGDGWARVRAEVDPDFMVLLIKCSVTAASGDTVTACVTEAADADYDHVAQAASALFKRIEKGEL